MVRSACFGLGGLAAGGLLTAAGPAGYRIAVLADAASFAACALLLALLVRTTRPGHHGVSAAGDAARPLSDRPFLTLIAASGLISLARQLFLFRLSRYAHPPP